ncbi:MAG: ferritin-like domain-containing protein [Tepidisphaera sp.]
MKIMTMSDLYVDQIQDIHSCERQLIKTLPKMAKAASHPQLRDAINKHLVETKGQLERLNTILESLGKTAGRKVCRAAVGLIEEGSEIVDAEADEEVRDAGLICAAQKIEHYEIATYGCLRTYAQLLGRTADVRLLEKTLSEEKKADDSLTTLATGLINAEALS